MYIVIEYYQPTMGGYVKKAKVCNGYTSAYMTMQKWYNERMAKWGITEIDEFNGYFGYLDDYDGQLYNDHSDIMYKYFLTEETEDEDDE